MRAIITGGAGFIGSHLADFLVKKKNIKKILILDNFKDGSKKNLKGVAKSKKVKIFKCDIRKFQNIKKFFKDIDVVFHLAALSDIVPSIVNPISYMETNINGTINVLEAMRYHGAKKIIYAASSSCYGIPETYPTNEKCKTDPKYPYAISKLIGEDILDYWYKVYGLNYVSLRLFNVYGPRSRTNNAYGAALGVFIKQKLSKKPFTVVGSGKQKRDFIYVEDVCNAFYNAAISKIFSKKINIGKGEPRSVNDMLKIIGGKRVEIPKRPGEPFQTFADISLAKAILRWKPAISLEVGLNKVLKNSSYWKRAPLWTPKNIKTATKTWFKYLK